MLLGRYDILIDRQRYAYPYRMNLKITEMSDAKSPGTPLKTPENYKLEFQGLMLDLEGVRYESMVQISLDP